MPGIMADENIPSSYVVPLLPVDGILDVLNNGLFMQVKKADLIPGNPDKLKEIYLVILELLHPNLSFISQQRFKDLGDAPPDELEDSVVALNIYGILKTVLGRMNFYDICFGDVFIPSFKRSQVILSHLINAWRFVVNSRDEAKVPLREKFNMLSVRKAALLADAPNLPRKFNDATTEIFELREATNALYQQQVAIRSEMKEELTKKETIQPTNAEKKALYGRLGQENQALTEALAELKNQNAKLDEKVVNSPEQLEDRAEVRKQAIASLKSEIAKGKKRWNDAVEHARNCSIWRTRVLALLKRATAIKEEMTFAIKAKHGDLNAIDSQKQTLRENISDVEATYEDLVSSLKKLQEMDGMLKHQHFVKKNSVKTQLKEAQMSKKKIMKNVTQLEIALTGANEEYDELIVRLKLAKSDFKAAEKKSKSHLETMAALEVYHGILATYLVDLELVVDRLTSPKSCEAVRKAVGSFDKEGT